MSVNDEYTLLIGKFMYVLIDTEAREMVRRAGRGLGGLQRRLQPWSLLLEVPSSRQYNEWTRVDISIETRYMHLWVVYLHNDTFLFVRSPSFRGSVVLSCPDSEIRTWGQEGRYLENQMRYNEAANMSLHHSVASIFCYRMLDSPYWVNVLKHRSCSNNKAEGRQDFEREYLLEY